MYFGVAVLPLVHQQPAQPPTWPPAGHRLYHVIRLHQKYHGRPVHCMRKAALRRQAARKDLING
jgi:hypothetical protein